MPRLLFVCNESTDLLVAARACSNCWATQRFDSVSDALRAANPIDALLIGARSYPSVTTVVTDQQWAAIDALNLTTYVEFPAALPAPARTQLPPPDAVAWRRVVVSDASSFAPWAGDAPNLKKLGLMHVHKSARFVDLSAATRGAQIHEARALVHVHEAELL